MKKIVMLGCENSHVKTFLTIMKNNPEKYREIEVIGVYSEDEAAMAQVCDAFAVPAMKTYDEAVGVADGIVVTARHGGKHWLPAVHRRACNCRCSHGRRRDCPRYPSRALRQDNTRKLYRPY